MGQNERSIWFGQNKLEGHSFESPIDMWMYPCEFQVREQYYIDGPAELNYWFWLQNGENSGQ